MKPFEIKTKRSTVILKQKELYRNIQTQDSAHHENMVGWKIIAAVSAIVAVWHFFPRSHTR